MCQFEGWTTWLEPAVLLRKPEDHEYQKPSYMTRTEPMYTPEEEYALIDKQVNDSDGFDIDFSPFVCVFNYHPAVFTSHQLADEPETDGDLLKRLALGSLDDHNNNNKTEFEFVKVVKANFHWSAAIMYLITFQVLDPFDNKIKLFQARVRHAEGIVTQYVFCRPKPGQGVKCIGKKDVEINVEKAAKKQKIEVMPEGVST